MYRTAIKFGIGSVFFFLAVLSVANVQGEELDVAAVQPRKDTKMLCLKCDDRTGDHAWDSIHKLGPGEQSCPHSDDHCWVAAVTMINHFYGGTAPTLIQDEIAFHEKKDKRAHPFPKIREQRMVITNRGLRICRLLVGPSRFLH